MSKKTTEELQNVLGRTHIDQMQRYYEENGDSFLSEQTSFSDYMRKVIRQKGLKQHEVFRAAEIPERYGYKLISQEKHTLQRDIIIRLCYAAHFSLEEVQHALRLYRMPELYPKMQRDALLMVAFNEHPGSIRDVNNYLCKNGMEILHSSGGAD